MGRAGRQFRALLWKNWLCRIRHPVSAACSHGPGRSVWWLRLGTRGWSGCFPHLCGDLGKPEHALRAKCDLVEIMAAAFNRKGSTLEKVLKRRYLNYNWCFAHLL